MFCLTFNCVILFYITFSHPFQSVAHILQQAKSVSSIFKHPPLIQLCCCSVREKCLGACLCRDAKCISITCTFKNDGRVKSVPPVPPLCCVVSDICVLDVSFYTCGSFAFLVSPSPLNIYSLWIYSGVHHV